MEDTEIITQPQFNDRYELKHPMLADTQLSHVWRAQDKRYLREVVIKLFNPTMEWMSEEDKEGLERRFELEATAIAQINHPNVVQIFDYGLVNGVPYMAMEYIKGRNLDDAVIDLKRKARRADREADDDEFPKASDLYLEEFLTLFYQVCDGISYVHKKKVVHRDLKPGNILLSKKGHLVVCDLGLSKKIIDDDTMFIPANVGEKVESKKVDSTSEISVRPELYSRDNLLMGTFGFMAPEQVHCQSTDERTDIYQLGAILYFGITGFPPFASDSNSFERRRTNRDHSFDMPQDLDPMLNAILVKSMHEDKAERYQSAEQIRDSVGEYLEEMLNRDHYLLIQNSGRGFFKKTDAPKKIRKRRLNWTDLAKTWARG